MQDDSFAEIYLLYKLQQLYRNLCTFSKANLKIFWSLASVFKIFFTMAVFHVKNGFVTFFNSFSAVNLCCILKQLFPDIVGNRF